jgi:predicted alpha/beta hydrolase
VEQRRLSGYVEMMLDPHRTVIPSAIIEAAVGFALSGASSPPSTKPRAALELRERAEFDVDGTTIIEEPVRVDAYQWGIATRTASSPRRAVLLLNAGAVGRIGPNRLYTRLARRLAAGGHLVLRLDLAGIGDSGTHAASVENTVYSTHAVDDVAAAVTWLRRTAVDTLAVVGLCSGAYHALRAAHAGLAIDTVVAINPLTFHYKPGMPLDFAAFRVAADAARYQRAMANGRSWRKLLRGQVDLKRVVKIVWLRGIATLARPMRELLRTLRVPMRDDLGSELSGLARRGVRVRFVFAASDPGRTLLFEQGGSVVPRLLADNRIAITTIDGPDHTFTPRWSHAALLDAVAAAIEAG